MRSDSLLHDCAWSAAASVVQVFASFLREEEQRDAFEEVYTRIKAALVRYEEKADRLRRRVDPSNN